MLTIIQSESKAWAVAATNGDLRIFSREQGGEWSEVLLSEDSEQIDEDGSLILEAVYEQRTGKQQAEAPPEPADEEPEEPEADEEEEPEADEEEEPEADEEEEPEGDEEEEPEADEEEEEEKKPRRSRGRTRAKKS